MSNRIKPTKVTDKHVAAEEPKSYTATEMDASYLRGWKDAIKYLSVDIGKLGKKVKK